MKDEYIQNLYTEIEDDLCLRIGRVCKRRDITFGKNILEQVRNDENIRYIIEDHLDLSSKENAVLLGDKELFKSILMDEFSDTIGEALYDELYNS